MTSTVLTNIMAAGEEGRPGSTGVACVGQGRGLAEKDGEKREMGPRQTAWEAEGGGRGEWGVGVGTSWFRPDADVRWVTVFSN